MLSPLYTYTTITRAVATKRHRLSPLSTPTVPRRLTLALFTLSSLSVPLFYFVMKNNINIAARAHAALKMNYGRERDTRARITLRPPFGLAQNKCANSRFFYFFARARARNAKRARAPRAHNPINHNPISNARYQSHQQRALDRVHSPTLAQIRAKFAVKYVRTFHLMCLCVCVSL